MLAIALAAVAASCEAEDGVANRRAEVAEVVSALALEPFGSQSTAPSEVRVKGGSPYFVATGILEGGRERAVDAVRDALVRSQWQIHSEGPVPHFLGWETLGVKGSDVILISIGQGVTDVANSPYQPLTGRSYVQVSVAGKDSGPQWTQVQ